MAEQTWKDKHLIELKKQKKNMEAQIEMDKARYAENIQTLKDITEVIEKLEAKQR
jgi:hypothetical protein